MSLNPGVAHGKIGSRALNAAMDDAIRYDTFTVATLPDAAANKDKMIVVSNGASGAKCLAYSDGTSWLRVLLGTAVSAT
jgi:hypothetical protein